MKHLNKIFRGLKRSVNQGSIEKVAHRDTDKGRKPIKPPSVLHSSTKANVIFLYAKARKASGSSVMRGEQLSRLLSDHLFERAIYYSCEKDWRGCVLFLTKGFLETASIDVLNGLKSNGNLLLADFVDGKPSPKKVDCIDVLIAASQSAYAAFKTDFPTKPVFHLTHHVDPRIQPGNDVTGLSIGYIGEEVNAIWTDRIKEQVKIVQVHTNVVDNSWLKHIRGLNVHYAVRHARAVDGHKPFLKGFTAARCNAPILIQKNSGDALYYLGEDYPFFLPSAPTEQDILNALETVRSSYGGQVWNQAMDRMRLVSEQTQNDVIADEFRKILAV